jgi:hypothetical protein
VGLCYVMHSGWVEAFMPIYFISNIVGCWMLVVV